MYFTLKLGRGGGGCNQVGHTSIYTENIKKNVSDASSAITVSVEKRHFHPVPDV